jgi:TatA/E family protein of Tat protein translocase
MPFIGPNEAIMIGAALLALVLGPKKLPELARALGDSKKEYKKSMQEANDVVEDATPDAQSEIEDLKEN